MTWGQLLPVARCLEGYGPHEMQPRCRGRFARDPLRRQPIGEAVGPPTHAGDHGARPGDFRPALSFTAAVGPNRHGFAERTRSTSGRSGRGPRSGGTAPVRSDVRPVDPDRQAGRPARLSAPVGRFFSRRRLPARLNLFAPGHQVLSPRARRERVSLYPRGRKSLALAPRAEGAAFGLTSLRAEGRSGRR